MTAPGPRIAEVSPAQRRVILEVMRTGAEAHHIAHTLGIAKGTVFNHITAVKAAAGHDTLLSLVLALERGQVKLRVTPSGRTGRRT